MDKISLTLHAKETAKRYFKPDEIAFLICDMYDTHWCISARKHYNELAIKIGEYVNYLHEKNVLIIHSPTCVIDYYDAYPQREKLRLGVGGIRTTFRLPSLPPHNPTFEFEPCPCGCSYAPVWHAQHPAIPIGENDVISSSFIEIVSYLTMKNIDTLVYMGTAANQCIIDREIGLAWRKTYKSKSIVLRDLTSVFPVHLDPLPVYKYIEENFCPTATLK